MMVKLVIDNNITVLTCYAPYVRLDNTVKVDFYDLLHSTVSKIEVT